MPIIAINGGASAPCFFVHHLQFLLHCRLLDSWFEWVLNMRLSYAQVEAIKQEAVYFSGAQAELCLSGPCVDDTQSGSEECYRLVLRRAAGL